MDGKRNNAQGVETTQVGHQHISGWQKICIGMYFKEYRLWKRYLNQVELTDDLCGALELQRENCTNFRRNVRLSGNNLQLTLRVQVLVFFSSLYFPRIPIRFLPYVSLPVSGCLPIVTLDTCCDFPMVLSLEWTLLASEWPFRIASSAGDAWTDRSTAYIVVSRIWQPIGLVTAGYSEVNITNGKTFSHFTVHGPHIRLIAISRSVWYPRTGNANLIGNTFEYLYILLLTTPLNSTNVIREYPFSVVWIPLLDLAYFLYFEKKVGLWYNLAVSVCICVPPTTFERLNRSSWGHLNDILYKPLPSVIPPLQPLWIFG